MSTLYLIDASPYIFRAYYSLPDSIRSPDGAPTNAVYGFTGFLIQILKKSPSHLAVAFDGSLTTSFRNELYPEYKAQRSRPPEDLKAQLDNCQKIAGAMGMATFIDDKYEAEDIIGTFVKRLVVDSQEAVVVSGDKDLAQLVSENVLFWDFARDRFFDPQKVEAHFGVQPSQIVDLLALMGDSIDNIPGVHGIGKKTAVTLLHHFGTLENIYENLDKVPGIPLRSAKAVASKLIEGREMAELSKRLATISFDVPVQGDLESLEYPGANRGQIDALFEHLGFDAIKDRIPVWNE